jgi:hypothetical protein
MYSITSYRHGPVATNVVEFERYAPFTPATKFVDPPDKFVAFKEMALDAVELKVVPAGATYGLYLVPFGFAVFAPEAVGTVPVAALTVPVAAIVPLEVVENELTMVFVVSTEEIVIFPAEAAVPR